MTTPLPEAQSPDYTLGFYARQPVFESGNKIWAYSIYFRNGELDALPPEAAMAGATNSVLAALMGEDCGLPRIIKFTAQSLAYELPLLFPRESLVVELREELSSDAAAMEAIRRLKAKGYTLAVSHFSARPGAAALYALADIIWVDALTREEADMARLAAACRPFQARAGLMRIESPAVHKAGLGMGFSLFQGNFFQVPEMVRTRRLSSNHFSRLKLLQAIEQEEPDLKALAETVRADVALSYKLFGLLNSARFSFPAPIHSVQQALTLLGWEPLRTWIRLVILTDMTPAGKSSELPRAATVRGRFLELAARGADKADAPRPESLFLAGLFSLLPALLDQPMLSILEGVRLPGEVTQALLDHEHPAALWLGLAKSFERADWAGVQAAIAGLGLNPLSVAQAYAQALAWTDSLYRGVSG